MPGGSNLTGSVYGQRQASNEVSHSYAVNFNTTGIGSGVLLDTIRASADRPVQIEVSAQVVTAFNAGTGNVLTVGNTSGATEYLDSTAITEGTPGFYPAANAVFKARLTADTPIYAKFAQSGTPATTGAAIIILREFSENPRAIA